MTAVRAYNTRRVPEKIANLLDSSWNQFHPLCSAKLTDQNLFITALEWKKYSTVVPLHFWYDFVLQFPANTDQKHIFSKYDIHPLVVVYVHQVRYDRISASFIQHDEEQKDVMNQLYF